MYKIFEGTAQNLWATVPTGKGIHANNDGGHPKSEGTNPNMEGSQPKLEAALK